MKKIYLTIDTECHDIKKKNLYIDGKIGDDYWGIKKILEVGEQEKIPLNFFVDIPETKRYGDKYILDIVNLIKSYNQNICFHLHPNFISGDNSRPFIWQYSYDEKESIFKEALELYRKYVGAEPNAFRIGCYGMDEEMYSIMDKCATKQLIDLSYSYSYNACHLKNDTCLVNKKYGENIIILPNTRFIGFSFLSKKKYVNLDITSSNFNEMVKVLDSSNLENMTCTMHSWNLFKHFFYMDSTLRKDEYNRTKMIKFIRYAKQSGYTFCSFDDYHFDHSNDCEIDLTKGIKGFCSGLINTFFRMQRVARLNKKYFAIYSVFYLILILFFVIALLAVL